MKKTFVIICLIGIIFNACSPKENNIEKEEEKDTKSYYLPDWVKNANIYEVNLRQYTPEGTINAFSDHLPRLKDMGVDILWFMPIFPIGVKERKGSLGSYYSIADYKGLNPEHGSMQDFHQLVKKAHLLGLKVILDWVPNHTAWDHPWISSNPDYYLKINGKITDPINPETGEPWGWTDVAQLDFSNMAMRAEMISDMAYWIKEHNVDGFRMDAAHMMPLDFWQQVRDTLRALNPELYLLAESDVPEHLNDELFHTAYGWSLHHLLNEIAQSKKKAKDIDEWFLKEKSKFKKGFFMHFTSNHDENSWAGSEFDRMGDAHRVMAVLTYTIDGMPLIYSGQEEPLRRRLKFFDKDNINFRDYKYGTFYRTLNLTKRKNEALWNGEHGGELVKISDHEHVYAFKREKNGNKVIAILNLQGQISKFRLNENVEGVWNIFGGAELKFNKDEDIYLDPWAYYVGTNIQ